MRKIRARNFMRPVSKAPRTWLLWFENILQWISPQAGRSMRWTALRCLHFDLEANICTILFASDYTGLFVSNGHTLLLLHHRLLLVIIHSICLVCVHSPVLVSNCLSKHGIVFVAMMDLMCRINQFCAQLACLPACLRGVALCLRGKLLILWPSWWLEIFRLQTGSTGNQAGSVEWSIQNGFHSVLVNGLEAYRTIATRFRIWT